MAKTPKLSICVPSRNRQYYFQKTIEGLMRRAREDVEFVFVDNSDDHAVMNDYMAELKDDPRIVYIPSEDRVLSMMDNWERTIAAATGDWICVIGDDDFVDPNLLDVLNKVVTVNPEVEAFSWGVAAYTWPSETTQIHSLFIPYNSFVVKVPRDEPYKRMFGWYGANAVPTCGYSIYHSAISRSLLERIKALYGGKYFEHPVIDYDMAMKVIMTGRHFAYCQRPFSIMGSCPESNSFAIGRLEDLKKKVQIFMDELGHNFDDDEHVSDFPFASSLGVTASIVVAQQWFRTKYNVDYAGWEKEFAAACTKNAEMFHERESFDIVTAGYAAAFAKWQGGRFAKYFKPKFRELGPPLIISGSKDEGIYIRSDIADIKNPEDLYDIINAISTPTELIDVPDEGLKFPWEQMMQNVDGPPRPVQILQKRVA